MEKFESTKIDLKAYDELLQRYKRDLNRIRDKNKIERMNGLTNIKLFLSKEENKAFLQKFYIQELMSCLGALISDEFDKNRRLSIEILDFFSSNIQLNSEDYKILPFLFERFKTYPVKEKDEELQSKLLNLIRKFLSLKPDEFEAYMPEVSSVIEHLLKEKNKAMKEECANFVIHVSELLKKKIGKYFMPVIIELGKNLTHSNAKTREISAKALCSAGLTEKAGPFIAEVIKALKAKANDDKNQVRVEVYNCIKNWLSGLEYTYLKTYEAEFILILMNGLSDNLEEIRKLCYESLEYYGINLKKLLIELKEDISGINEYAFDKQLEEMA